MGVWDFLTADYQTRQARTRALNQGLLGLFNGITPGLGDRVSSANALINPIDQMGEAGGNTVVAFDSTRPRHERMQAGLNAGIGTITAAAPAIGAAAIGAPARRGILETVANVTGPVDDAATRFLADESGSVPIGRGTLPTPRNDAEAMARDILEMRAAGRASEVTDDMMAAADPQYMFNHTPLPMDAASRAARATDAGFTTGRDRQDVMRELRKLDNPQLVHYTNQDFNEFRIPERENRQAIWATPDPNANLATKDNWRSFDEEGVNGIPIMARMSQRVSPFEFRMDGDPMTPGFPRNVTLADVAKANSVGADYAEAGLEYAIFDPRNIRSRFARFDPEFRHLANLSAGLGGVGLLGYIGDQQQDNGPAYLPRAY